METGPRTELIDPTVDAIAAQRAELQQLTTDELRDQLAAHLQLTAEHMLRTALVVRELEERGEDLTDLKLGLLPYLRRIAHGQVVPELVVRYAGFPALIQRLSSFPLPEQRKIAAGEPVELLVLRGETSDTRKVDPLHLTRDQLYQVFARDHIRTTAEQAALLEDVRAKPRAPKRPKKTRVRTDAERGGLVVGRSFVSVDEVLHALAELRYADYESDREGEEQSQTPVYLTAAEKQQLKIRAAKSNASMGDLIRRAMVAHGLIRGEAD